MSPRLTLVLNGWHWTRMSTDWAWSLIISFSLFFLSTFLTKTGICVSCVSCLHFCVFCWVFRPLRLKQWSFLSRSFTSLPSFRRSVKPGLWWSTLQSPLWSPLLFQSVFQSHCLIYCVACCGATLLYTIRVVCQSCHYLKKKKITNKM